MLNKFPQENLMHLSSELYKIFSEKKHVNNCTTLQRSGKKRNT